MGVGTMVTIAFGGDAMLGRMVGRELLGRPPDTSWEKPLLDLLATADATIVNLECCISERGEPWPAPGKPFFFRAPPVATGVLRAAGVRAVWLANNHALDFGTTALLDTFNHLAAAGIAWAGAGMNAEEARRGTVVDIGGTRLGLVGWADHPADYGAMADSPGTAWVDPQDLARDGPPAWLVAEIGRLAAECDIVAVGPHWGPNMSLRPQAHHPVVARALVRAGASIIVGHSAHVVQPVALVDGAPVCYDLGDLLDDYAIDEDLRNDLGLLALFTPGERLELIPLRLHYTRTGLATGDDRQLIVGRLTSAASRSGLPLHAADDRLVVDLR
jgi:poly-gamma-glutamate capsule biosynthesis protein CapA/YwtB (metallophosphatase superfamily)